jgi:hypothetical protein
LSLLALLSLPPLLARGPVSWVPSPESSLAAWAGKLGVLLLMLLSFAVAARGQDPGERPACSLLLILLAGLLTAWHWHGIDRKPANEEWQRDLYWEVLGQARGEDAVPHVYRPLPYVPMLPVLSTLAVQALLRSPMPTAHRPSFHRRTV